MATKLSRKAERTDKRQDGDISYTKTAKFGKLVRVDLTLRDWRIVKIKITGDFFLHPEEKIEELESSLLDTNVKDMHDIQNRVQATLKDCQYYGFELEQFVELIYSFSE